jgi:hypothetical protein
MPRAGYQDLVPQPSTTFRAHAEMRRLLPSLRAPRPTQGLEELRKIRRVVANAGMV